MGEDRGREETHRNGPGPAQGRAAGGCGLKKRRGTAYPSERGRQFPLICFTNDVLKVQRNGTGPGASLS